MNGWLGVKEGGGRYDVLGCLPSSFSFQLKIPFPFFFPFFFFSSATPFWICITVSCSEVHCHSHIFFANYYEFHNNAEERNVVSFQYLLLKRPHSAARQFVASARASGHKKLSIGKYRWDKSISQKCRSSSSSFFFFFFFFSLAFYRSPRSFSPFLSLPPYSLLQKRILL